MPLTPLKRLRFGPWSTQQAARLRELWQARDEEGAWLYDRRLIAEMMGLTLSAVVARLGREYRAGTLQQRSGPMVSVPAETPSFRPRGKPLSQTRDAIAKRERRAREREHKPAPMRPQQPAETPSFRPSAPPLPPPDPAETPSFQPVTLRRCHFPLWPHGTKPDHRYCDRPVVAGTSYCADHCATAFLGSRAALKSSPFMLNYTLVTT